VDGISISMEDESDLCSGARVSSKVRVGQRSSGTFTGSSALTYESSGSHQVRQSLMLGADKR
jgi:hypothetical protein